MRKWPRRRTSGAAGARAKQLNFKKQQRYIFYSFPTPHCVTFPGHKGCGNNSLGSSYLERCTTKWRTSGPMSQRYFSRKIRRMCGSPPFTPSFQSAYKYWNRLTSVCCQLMLKPRMAPSRPSPGLFPSNFCMRPLAFAGPLTKVGSGQDAACGAVGAAAASGVRGEYIRSAPPFVRLHSHCGDKGAP